MENDPADERTKLRKTVEGLFETFDYALPDDPQLVRDAGIVIALASICANHAQYMTAKHGFGITELNDRRPSHPSRGTTSGPN